MERVDLGGDWNLRHIPDGSDRPMSVPGDILSALVASGEAPDPYFGTNELGLQWIGRADWLLSRSFVASPALLERSRAFVEFDSIDTVAEIRLNGRPIGASDNMFRRFRADVTGLLRPGENVVSVTIRSPEREAADRAGRLPYPVPASVYPVSSPHRNLVRKAQCMGGWDWGPCLMTGGLYDGAAVVGIDGPRIEYVRARTRKAPGAGPGGDYIVELSVRVDSDKAMDAVLEIALAGARATRRVAVQAGSAILREELLVAAPEEWWPAGYGKQSLYDLRVSVAPADGGPGAHEVVKRVGFRELRVDALEDPHGKSMTIVVNGKPIFAKGANWIPADALPSRWTRERLSDLLGSAAAANMNCLRVWGGGRYECDAFYDLCDELGLLVWQDCMFSCALYPASAEFLSDVEAEIRHQVGRLADHPSIALWCGNNEALGAITWYEESKRNPSRYVVDYDRLTEGTVGRVVRELDPDRAWWPSSPSAGPNDYADNWHADGRGDMHFWSVWHEGKPFSEYLGVRPRFCSEFGFQALPSYSTVRSFAPEGQRNVSSPVMEHHQRNPRGNSIIVETMLRYFRMPRGFRETLYLSQVQQAMAIKTAVEYWRCNRPRCMGALYWQLNDVWPGASWSSLEYDGSWRLLHHEARRFFDPLLLALFVKDGVAFAYAVNDGPQAIRAGLSLSLRRFDGSLVADLREGISGRGPVSALPEAATLLWSRPLPELPAGPDECYVDAALSPEGLGGDGRARRACLFLTEPKACPLADAGIEAEVITADDTAAFPAAGRTLPVRLRAKAPAFYVAPSADGLAGRFEDSGFHLAAGEERVVRFVPAPGSPGGSGGAPTARELRSALRVDDLRSSYE
ncbi:MAG: glycoside hydrolase family 2 protein [Spirochaetes bacterium]|nr:glycoside hydrolase family 2 protein [Spirochaetota bacterium]